MLEMVTVSKSRSGRRIIASASLVVRAGEIVCLSGPSGIGKTTLLELMAGVSRPDSGSVRRTVLTTLMFQENALLPWLTAEDNIRYILPSRMTDEECYLRSSFWLKRFGIDPKQYPAAMSGGGRRRLSLARTFAAGRELLLFDEPFAFLDEAWQIVAAEEIAIKAAEGAAVVLSTHTTAPFSQPCFVKVPYRIIPLTKTPINLPEN